jgi:prophage regulatory protein
MAESNPMSEKLKLLVAQRHLRRPAVEAVTGLSRSSIYEMMDKGEFPRPIRIGKRAVAWPQSTIEEWLANRPTSQGAAG